MDEAHIRTAPQNLTLIHSRALAEAPATPLRIKFYTAYERHASASFMDHRLPHATNTWLVTVLAMSVIFFFSFSIRYMRFSRVARELKQTVRCALVPQAANIVTFGEIPRRSVLYGHSTNITAQRVETHARKARHVDDVTDSTGHPRDAALPLIRRYDVKLRAIAPPMIQSR